MAFFSKKEICIICGSPQGQYNTASGLICKECLKKVPKNLKLQLSKCTINDLNFLFVSAENPYKCTICGNDYKLRCNKLKCADTNGFICTPCSNKTLSLSLKKSTLEQIKDEVAKNQGRGVIDMILHSSPPQYRAAEKEIKDKEWKEQQKQRYIEKERQRAKKEERKEEKKRISEEKYQAFAAKFKAEVIEEELPDEWDDLDLIDSFVWVFVTGSLHDYKGDLAQENISLLKMGERVYLKRQGSKRFPNAIRVVDFPGNHLGWIPEDNDEDIQQEQIAKQLDAQTEYLCRVCNIREFKKSGENYLCIDIDIGFYR
ncbi:MAG: hypothetical protein RSF13_09465 [Clostridiales bacterium]